VYGWVVRVGLDRTPDQARPQSPLWLWYAGPEPPDQARPQSPLWLWYAGPEPPDPALSWRAYVHRFDLEHTQARRLEPYTASPSSPEVRRDVGEARGFPCFMGFVRWASWPGTWRRP
jgi:hypothetical protein